MIRIIITVLITCFLFSLHSCNTKRDYGQYLNRQLKLHCFSYTGTYDTIVIIPREGCNACINDANSFFEKNRYNDSYLFIFTKLSTQKELTILFGEEVLKADNVLIDKKNLFYLFDEPDSHYPLILTKEMDNKGYSYNQLNL
ncbi:MAG: hypothetical protein LBL07_09400 [Tannerella sp.]|jgi:hypothetical protein|nr:hypothetical protein [Tannerella sp.]